MVKTKNSIFLVIMVIAGIATLPSAFAVDIVIPPGTSVPECAQTSECYIPSTVTINAGDQVSWLNEDSTGHTVTSGTPDDGKDGVFDSGLLLGGEVFTQTFGSDEIYDYYCLLHPWQIGVVIVGAAAIEDTGEPERIEPPTEEDTKEPKRITDFENLFLDITHGTALAGETLTIDLKFTDSNGNDVTHVNYDIKATQDGKMILEESGMHNHDGEGHHVTMPVSSDVSDDSPVDVEVTFQGFGIEEPFTGPIGEVTKKQVVPEFGTIAMMILAVSILSIIIFSTKTRIIQKF